MTSRKTLARRRRLLALYRSMVLIRSFEGQLHPHSRPALAPEAVTVGVAAALDPDDYVVTLHRDHRFELARRIDQGGWRIVTGGLRAATEHAQTLVNTGRPGAVLCALRGGAASSADLHQSLDLGAIRRLPVVVLLHCRHEPRTQGERVDGDDVEVVHDAAARLLRHARREREPAVLEATTYGGDPLSVAAGRLVELGMDPEELLEMGQLPARVDCS